MAAGLSMVTVAFFVLAAGIEFGPVFIALLTVLIGAGLGSTMPAAQTMVQWAAGAERLGVGTAAVSFSRWECCPDARLSSHGRLRIWIWVPLRPATKGPLRNNFAFCVAAFEYTA
jgi:hypothetical protein